MRSAERSYCSSRSEKSGGSVGGTRVQPWGYISPQWSPTMPENLLTDLKVRSAKSTDRDWKLSDGGGLFLL
ncbi:integrase, partial [Pseudomonas aeruginosa]